MQSYDKRFFTKINFSSANEDGRSETRALRLGRKDRVLVIAGSGARVLDLLLEEPREIVAIDLNPTQLYLLELKLVAMAHLAHAELLDFLGVSDRGNRLEVYRDLAEELSPACREYWNGHPGAIRSGVLYCGRWERFLRGLSIPARVGRRRLLDALFACTSIDEQVELWSQRWNTRAWRGFVRAVSARFLWTSVLREPGMRLVPRSFPVGEYLLQRFEEGVRHTLLRSSPFLRAVFYGRYDPSMALPPHLMPASCERIRSAHKRVKLVNASLSEYLNTEEAGSFDGFSLSDFSSYATPAEYQNVWDSLLRHAGSGARFCERILFVPRDPAQGRERLVLRDHALEQRLAIEDDSLFYTFLAGELAGS